MKQQVRELLVTTKAAEHWQDNFDEKVDELMCIITKVDTQQQVQHAGELLNVYQKSKKKPRKNTKAAHTTQDKPFEFLVFRN